MLTVEEGIDISALQSALNSLLQHHDALRLRFEQVSKENGWLQQYAELDNFSVPLDHIDLTGEDVPSVEETMFGLQSSLQLSEGPLFRSVLITLKPAKYKEKVSSKRLLLIAHHLVVDGVSWRILLADLLTAYQQAVNGQALALPA